MPPNGGGSCLSRGGRDGDCIPPESPFFCANCTTFHPSASVEPVESLTILLGSLLAKESPNRKPTESDQGDFIANTHRLGRTFITTKLP